MSAQWEYPRIRAFEVQGRDLSEDNFAQEGRSSLDILIRETLQNPLDARSPGNTGAVTVKIRTLGPQQFDRDYLQTLLTDEYMVRLKASGGEVPGDLKQASVLVVEDYGTTGLQGAYDNQDADGSGENWNAFWFREGEGAKATAGSNGRAGQGKITYYRASAVRAVFAQTVRESDSKSLMMGRAAFRKVYASDGVKYRRHSFWCAGTEQPLPETDPAAIVEFAAAFQLSRQGKPGLSLVIPCPVGFDIKEAVRTTIAEFYYPIAIGRLVADLGGVVVDASTIDALADIQPPPDDANDKRPGFSKGYRSFVRDIVADQKAGKALVLLASGWEKNGKLSMDSFPAGVVEQLRAALDAGERISVRCPIAVRPRSGPAVPSWFDVHLQIPDDLVRSEEAYIRRDLLIGAEAYLASSGNLQKAQALTLILDPPLSAFLADAEEPTHLKWNGSRPRLAEDYTNPRVIVSAVRNAAPKLLALLSNGLVKRDAKVLVDYFRSPGQGAPTGGGTQTATVKKPVIEPPIEPIVPGPRKPFRIHTGTTSVRILPNGKAGPIAVELPIPCVLELAYEGLDQDPFAAYDPFDFDVSDVTYPIVTTGATVTTRAGNRVDFVVTAPDFSVEVGGFDPNIRLKARLAYTEKSNGTPISDQ